MTSAIKMPHLWVALCQDAPSFGRSSCDTENVLQYGAESIVNCTITGRGVSPPCMISVCWGGGGGKLSQARNVAILGDYFHSV